MLQGHVDVVTTAGQNWTHPPFEARLEDGYVWGRGALDMKAGVAMLVSAFVRAKREGVQLPGDLVLVVLSDEEGGGNLGARYLVEEHPELFEGMRYGLGEFGGFTLEVGGKRFYPIQVAEKQICWLKATIRGPGGHGAMINRGGTVARLAPLPHRPRPQAAARARDAGRARDGREDGRGAAAAPGADHALAAEAAPDRSALSVCSARVRAQFEPMLRNTVNATIVRGGAKVNVVPSEIELELDGRALPGFTPEQLIAELHDLAGDDIEVELVRHDRGASTPDLGLFDTLAEVIRELDPEGIPMPLLQIGVTDGRFFAQAGVQTYGFLPMRLPPDFAFLEADPRRGRADPGRRGRVRRRGRLARRAEVPLKILVLGGTKFLGRAIVEDGLARGHELTLFNRGETDPGLFPEAEQLRGDRKSDLSALEGRTWDAVIDTSGYVPVGRPRVRRAAARERPLRLRLERLGLRRLLHETDRGRARSPSSTGCRSTRSRPTTPTTGRSRRSARRRSQQVFGERALIVRPGLIVGPHDPTGRFTYWARRLERGGEILAPGAAGPARAVRGRP